MAEKKKIHLDGDWNKRIEKALAQKVDKKKTTAKKKVKRK